jgi:hypothetical protein
MSRLGLAGYHERRPGHRKGRSSAIDWAVSRARELTKARLGSRAAASWRPPF